MNLHKLTVSLFLYAAAFSSFIVPTNSDKAKNVAGTSFRLTDEEKQKIGTDLEKTYDIGEAYMSLALLASTELMQKGKEVMRWLTEKKSEQ